MSQDDPGANNEHLIGNVYESRRKPLRQIRVTGIHGGRAVCDPWGGKGKTTKVSIAALVGGREWREVDVRPPITAGSNEEE